MSPCCRRVLLTPLCRLRLVLLAAVVALLGVSAGGPVSHAADPELAGEASRLVFHGWSSDSKWVAYTRVYPAVARPGRPPQEAREQRMHRRIRRGRFDGFGKMVGGDVAAFASRRGYDAAACQRTQDGPRVFRFDCPRGVFTLTVDIGRTLGFSITRGDTLVFRHTFDRLYVGFDPALYPSPDGKQGFLAFHLDSGWDVDAAVFPLVLPPQRPDVRGPPAD